MSGYTPPTVDAPDAVSRAALRARNRRMGFILATVAAVFFLGVILKYALAHH